MYVPFPCRKGLNAKYLFITEFKDRKTLGFLTDIDNNFYVLNNKTYDVIKTGVPSFNLKRMPCLSSEICSTGRFV